MGGERDGRLPGDDAIVTQSLMSSAWGNTTITGLYHHLRRPAAVLEAAMAMVVGEVEAEAEAARQVAFPSFPCSLLRK